MKQNRVSLRERNRQRVAQRITTAAFELFSTIGYNQTTMDAIAERAEVSRATLFNYFPTKDALLMPYAKSLYTQHIQPEIQRYLDTQPTTLQALRFLLTSIHDQILTLPGMERALQQEFSHVPSFQKETDRAVVGFHDNVMAILCYGQQRGEVRTDIAQETLTRYVGVLCAFLLKNMSAEQSTQYTTDIDTLLSFLQSALRPFTAEL